MANPQDMEELATAPEGTVKVRVYVAGDRFGYRYWKLANLSRSV